jgi:DNA-binding response OmpR family regulator
MPHVSESIQCTIIVVDDDYELLAALQRAHLLAKPLWQLACVMESQVALDVAEAEDISLAVVDLIMPDRDGMEVIQALKRKNPKLPIIAITGTSAAHQGSIHAAALALGANRILLKPFSFSELREAIEQLLAAR